MRTIHSFEEAVTTAPVPSGPAGFDPVVRPEGRPAVYLSAGVAPARGRHILGHEETP